MPCKIALVGETSGACDRLVRSLAGHGVLAAQRATVRAIAPLIRGRETAALILDVAQLSESDTESVADLRKQHPQLKIMLFSPSHSHRYAIELQACAGVQFCRLTLKDAEACQAILHVLGDVGEEDSGTTSKSARVPLYDEEFLRRVGRSDVPVLLHGETGVGKEVMAKRLWAYSNRVGKPFLKLNCAALPSELIESELFGYEKGAFTGAIADKPGKFEQAQDGTILLDEIGDMDTRLQAKLLQVLQDGEVQPLGSRNSIKVNVRIMAATHRDLREAIAQNTFREDLFYRLSVINITIPPLRERRHDILPLAEELLSRHADPGSVVPAIPERLQRLMLEHRWPGNVRELENVMRRFLVYQDAGLLEAELTDASETPKPRLTVAKPPSAVHAPQSPDRVSFDRFTAASRSAESQLLLETLEAVRWNRRQAAARLNIDYKALLYKLQKHGIVESKAKRNQVIA